MTTASDGFGDGSKVVVSPPVEMWRRRSQRVTITIHWELRRSLQERADQEGRSLSNLMAYLLERGMAAEENA